MAVNTQDSPERQEAIKGIEERVRSTKQAVKDLNAAIKTARTKDDLREHVDYLHAVVSDLQEFKQEHRDILIPIRDKDWFDNKFWRKPLAHAAGLIDDRSIYDMVNMLEYPRQARWEQIPRLRESVDDDEEVSTALIPRWQQIANLRKDGKTESEISKETGLNKGTVRKHIQTAFARGMLSAEEMGTAPQPAAVGTKVHTVAELTKGGYSIQDIADVVITGRGDGQTTYIAPMRNDAVARGMLESNWKELYYPPGHVPPPLPPQYTKAKDRGRRADMGYQPIRDDEDDAFGGEFPRTDDHPPILQTDSIRRPRFFSSGDLDDLPEREGGFGLDTGKRTPDKIDMMDLPERDRVDSEITNAVSEYTRMQSDSPSMATSQITEYQGATRQLPYRQRNGRGKVGF